MSVARSLGIPVTSGFHTNFDHYSAHYGLGWLRPAVGAYLRSLHRRTRATLVPTAALAAELSCAGIPGVRVVGRGVDTALFDPRRRSEVLRTSWGAGPRTVVCLSVGRLAPEKNLSLVSRSLQGLPGDIRMVWVGDGPSRGALEQSHPDHVFAGVRRGEELAVHYASADIFLFSSLTETYGNVVAEAMASGLAVVAYRTAAAAEIVRPEKDGLVVPPGDETAFTTAAARLAGDAGLRQRLGSTARLAMLPRSWEQVVAQFETAILEAIHRPADCSP